jgi:TonB family protein
MNRRSTVKSTAFWLVPVLILIVDVQGAARLDAKDNDRGDPRKISRTKSKDRAEVGGDEEGVTPLMRAARDGEGWKIHDLLQAVDVNARDAQGWTALIYSAVKGDTEILSALLSGGADPNAKDESGNTALIHAAEEGHLDQVKALLRSSPDVNAVNNDGQTALNLALLKGRIEVADSLRQAGGVEGKQAAAPEQPRPLRPKSEKMDRKPRAKHVPSPEYTREARENKISGIIRVRVLVDASGKVQTVRIISGLPYGLSDEAKRVAYKMTFSPGTRKGQPVEMWVPVDLTFKIK